MKYVVCRVYKKRRLFLDIPFVFPELLSHDLAYEGFRISILASWPAEQGYSVRALSAGFISSFHVGPGCYGDSTTLQLKSRGKKDDALLSMADYGACFSLCRYLQTGRGA